MSRQILPTTLSIAVAVVAVAALAALLAPSAAAQNTETCEFEQHPLFITDVDPVGVSTSDGTFLADDGMAFVESGDEIAFDVTIDNRVDEFGCASYPTDRTDQVQLELEYIYAVNDPSNDSISHTINPSQVCNNGDLRPDDDDMPCTTRIFLPGERTVLGPDDSGPGPGDVGEQRIRLTAIEQSDGGNPRELAGAERVIVVDALPDLSLDDNDDTSIDWETPAPGPGRDTEYSGFAGTEFDVTFQNVGDYPSWNPNNGEEYIDRSSFDAPDDGDVVPDEAPEDWTEPDRADSHENTDPAEPTDDYDDNGFPCQWASDDDVLDGDEPVCSYRRGKILDIPIAWTATDPDTGLEIDSGVNTDIGPGTGLAGLDKNASLLHTGHEGNDENIPGAPEEDPTTQNHLISGPDRTERAGTFDYEVRINDESADPLQRDDVTPEPDFGEQDNRNNDRTRDLQIFGVDLDVTDHGISVSGYQGEGLCTQPDELPCEAGAPIRVDPEYRNQGDGILDGAPDGSARDRDWNATVTLQIGQEGEEEVAETGGNDPDPVIEKNLAPIKASNENESSEKLFSQTYQIPSEGTGGKHILRIRLDHPMAYPGTEFEVDDPEGRIAEITEQPDCPSGWDDPDQWEDGQPPLDDATNTYCIPLYFNDTTVPEINSQAIQDSDADVPEILEGENATFQTNITDNSIETVDAVFEDPEGNETVTRPMHLNRSDPDPNLWEVNQSFEDLLGTYLFTVRVEDSGSHVNTSSMEFTVAELPKRITNPESESEHHVNNESGPLDEDAPRFRGTADDPENVFNVTINATDTGRDDSPFGKHLIVYDDDGEARVEVPMDDMVVCKVDPDGEAGPGDPQTRWGTECSDPSGPGAVVVTDTWKWFFVNNTETPWEGTENISLPWTGTFNLSAQVNDTFDRVNRSNWTVEISDRINDNGLVEPNVTEVDVGPSTLAPGQTLSASAYAKDALRVERVYLEVEKPSGDTTEADLDLTDPDPTEHNTGNGTWSGAFEAGVEGDVFDQAGDYEVKLVAHDFGDHPNVTDVGTVSVEPGDAPAIDAFFTEPPSPVEEDTPLRWVVDVRSQTAVQPPTLTIEKPDGETQTEEMTFNETLEAWTFETTPEAVLDGNEETWSYEVVVADYADQSTSAAGEIDILANTAPRAANWAPAIPGDQLPYGPPSPTIRTDLIDGNGVDNSTIVMRVDGEEVSPEITPIPVCEDCFRLRYTPTESYEAGDTVSVEVEATDLSEAELSSDPQSHQFRVDGTPPTATIDLNPSLRGDPAPIIGSTSDVNVSTNDAGAGPGELTVEVTSLAGASPNPTQSRTFEDGVATFRLQTFEDAFRGHGEYRIVATPTDAVDNEGEATQRRVQFDEAPPLVALEPQPGQPASVVTVRVEDLSSIDEVFTTFTADDGPERRIELERDGDLWTGQIVEPDSGEPYPENTTIEYTVKAADTWGNTGGTDPRSFLAGNTPPSVALDNPEDGDQLSGTVNVRWTATDDETPADQLNVSLWYQRPEDEQPREVPGATDVDNVGQYQLDTTLLPNGEMQLQVIAFDGATFSQATANVSVRNLGEAFSSVEIRGAEPDDGTPTLDPSQETTFSVQIDENVRRAWANVTQDGEVVRSYELTDAGGGTWEAAFTAPSQPGDYEIDLAALTPEGRLETQSAYGFQVAGEDKSFVPEWTILSVLFAGTVAVGAFGLSRRWG